MPSERNPRPEKILSYRGVTIGDLATASFVLCAVSGVFLIAPYDVRDGARSISEWLLANPGAVFFRNVHYWTAQLFLITTVLHVWDHLRAATEKRVGTGVWLRLILSVPVIAFLMLSGFLLRGDADARQAQRILEEIVTRFPLVGPLAATFLFGAGDQLVAIYLQHAATATIIVWLVIIEHARRLWPRTTAVAAVGFVTAAVSLFLSPGLHDGVDPRMKGPWYFLGLQEVLHWTPRPLEIVALGGGGLLLLWALPRLPTVWAARLKMGFLAATLGYALLCGVGLFLRGENWSWRPNWPDSRSDLRPGLIVPSASLAPAQVPTKLPVVLGRAEGCLVCHGNVTGLGAAHLPENIGCASCHGGDISTLDAKRAHAAMIHVPGNLVDAPRTCGTTACHADIIPRVERSIMSTFAGVIDVNRRVFGETVPPGAPPTHIRDLGHSAADSHVRQLCASCHLGQEKEAWGPIVQESRGGGCNACHLVYTPEAQQELARYEATPLGARTAIPSVHPTFTLNPENGHCFGCHSRSGRISTNYEGWHELRDPPTPAELKSVPTGPPQFRQLDDGRFFTRVQADVHHTRGLDCIDCHTATEVMGGGVTVRHKGEQVQIRCEDCHAQPLASQPAAAIDAESHKLLALRKWEVTPTQRFGTTRSGETLMNIIVGADGSGQLRRKRTGQTAELRAPLAVCREGSGHDRLSCASCHTPWAPRCTSCHTKFDPAIEGFDHVLQQPVQGAWTESSGAFEAAPPTLGIRLDAGDTARPQGVVDTFVPGMIMELDRNRTAGGTPDPVFRRLYARMSAHTTSREVRSCKSCHNDPIALGYGRGNLRYEVSGGEGRWQFTPAHAASPQDGLPADAWIGFLQPREGMVSTRDDVRPFNVEEQRRILRVGACLTCHADDSAPMRQSVTGFDSVLSRRRPACVLPVWSALPTARP